MNDVMPAVRVPPRRSPAFPLRGTLFLGVAFLVVVLDQVTKRLAEDRLRVNGRSPCSTTSCA